MRDIVAAGAWKPWTTAPKDGTEILLVLPGGHSDHYHAVCWDSGEDAWISRYHEDWKMTEESLRACHLLPMWAEINDPPSSLCEDSICQ
jgi:hypothetical protein